MLCDPGQMTVPLWSSFSKMTEMTGVSGILSLSFLADKGGPGVQSPEPWLEGLVEGQDGDSESGLEALAPALGVRLAVMDLPGHPPQ